MEVQGKLIAILPLQVYASGYRKRQFVIYGPDAVGLYTNPIVFTLKQEKSDLIMDYPIGTDLKVHFYIQGREYLDKSQSTRYQVELTCWKIEAVT